MEILLTNLEKAYKETDPKVHQYSGQANDWLYKKYGRAIKETQYDEDAVDIIKDIIALGITMKETENANI